MKRETPARGAERLLNRILSNASQSDYAHDTAGRRCTSSAAKFVLWAELRRSDPLHGQQEGRFFS